MILYICDIQPEFQNSEKYFLYFVSKKHLPIADFHTASNLFQKTTISNLDIGNIANVVFLFSVCLKPVYIINQYTTQYLGHGINNIYARINSGHFFFIEKCHTFQTKFEAVCNADASSTMISHANKASIVYRPKY